MNCSLNYSRLLDSLLSLVLRGERLDILTAIACQNCEKVNRKCF